MSTGELREYAVFVIDDRTGVTTQMMKSHNRDEAAAHYREMKGQKMRAGMRVVMKSRPDPGWVTEEV